MLKAREFRFDDLKNIEMNEIAKSHLLDVIFICMTMNNVKAETLFDETGYIHVIGIYGDIAGSDKKYLIGLYSKNCSRLAVRFIKKWIAEKNRNGYNLIIANTDESLDKFHRFVGKEYLVWV